MAPSPIRAFALKALLWLPASFFLWFWFASPLVWPVVHLAGHVLVAAMPGLFGEVTQHGYLMDVTTHVLVSQIGVDGYPARGELVLTINPMIYGYSLPLFAGLAMATPTSARRCTLQLMVALVVIWLAQTFGVVCESLKLLAFDAGAAGAGALENAALSANAVALAYQFGYLILPAVLPIALWLGLNRRFIEALVGYPGEPVVGSRGRNKAANGLDTR
ncbi:MAG: exosortase H-associated membrane protein [Rhodanobacteraceae bacterium]